MDTGLSAGIGSWALDHGFEASYSGTFQQNDDIRIPCRTKPVPFPYSKIKINIQSAQTGVSVLFKCYKNGSTLLGTATVVTGDADHSEAITPGVVAVDDVITWTISWSGTPVVLGITATMRLAQ